MRNGHTLDPNHPTRQLGRRRRGAIRILRGMIATIVVDRDNTTIVAVIFDGSTRKTMFDNFHTRSQSTSRFGGW